MLEATLRFSLTDRFPVIWASDSIGGLLGFTAGDFLSSKVSLRERIHPRDADIAGVLFSEDMREKAGSFNIRIRHADGRIRCIRGNYTKEAAPGGVILNLLLQDAKSLRREPDSQSTVANFEAMMENTGDAIYFKDRNHVLTSASRSMVPPSGAIKQRSELIGTTDYDSLPEELADIYYELEKQVFAGLPVAQQVQMGPTWDGKLAWIDIRKYPIKDENGEIVGLFGVARDITKRVQAEQALRKNEETLRESQRIAGVGSYVSDLRKQEWRSSGILDGLLGLEKKEVHTVAEWSALVHPGDLAALNEHMANDVLALGKPFNREYRIIRQDDHQVRWMHGQGQLEFDAQGKPIVLRGTIHDITEHKRAEDILAKSAEWLLRAQQVARMGFLDWDMQTNEIVLSDETCRLYGIAKTEFRTTPELVAGVVHPDDREKVRKNLESAMKGEGAYDIEHRIVRADGAILWTHSQGELFYDAAGRPKTLVGTTLDITERKLAETALIESKELLQLFIDHAPAALSMYDREMRLLAVSRRWAENFHKVGQEVIGHPIDEILPEIPERWKEVHRRGLAGEATQCGDDRLEREDGAVMWLRWEVRPWRSSDGAVGGIVIFSEDVTLQKESEERLRLSASVFTHACEGILITAPDGAILDVNDTFTSITGYARDEVLGRNPRFLNSGKQGAEFYAAMWRSLILTGQWYGEIWNRKKNGIVYPELLTISAVRDAAGNVLQYVALFSDITLLKENERKLQHVAHYDVLTGLPNRVLLADRLRQAMAQAHRRNQLLAVAYLDLDGFKAVNDRHGHETGDQLLTGLAARMKHALREGDTLARLGGDEFVAVLLDLPDTGASTPVLSRLLDAAAEPANIGDLTLRVSASVGVTFFPQPEDVDADQLLRQADQAMYQAKLSGRNRFHLFDSSQDRSARGRYENLEHIRKALAAREFVLYYQPVVNMRTGAVVGAEALIRWQHPERGLLPPALFLPVIEDHPLAIEVGEWVIDSALAQVEAWQATGLNFPVSVNVGAQQLQQPDFVDRLVALLAAHPAVSPSSLELEILETSALEDLAQVSQLLKACREIGVSLALDDFGTGYSSLTYLKRLPTNILKIDRSFVRDMLDDPENLTILEGVLGLAVAFSRQVIAEGVETVDHGMMLLQLGCELAQGYCIASPMPACDFPRWLANWRPDPRWANAPAVDFSDRPLLYAGVEHRAWIAAFEAYLQGRRLAPPMLDRLHCRFGVWLEKEERAGRGVKPEFKAVDALHRRVHALAADILAMPNQGRSPEGLARMGELQSLRDALLEHLREYNQLG